MSFKVIGVGEVLWDLLPSGPQLGGAPANFAYHARQLGAQARVISRVGNDDWGRRILQHFDEMGLGGDTIQVDERHPTGTARVTLGENGVPQFILDRSVAWDFIAVTEAARKAVAEADAVCFGSLAQRSESSAGAIRQLVSSAPAGAIKIFDINLRQNFFTLPLIVQSLEMAGVLKLNEEELAALARMFHLTGADRRKIEELARRFTLRAVALTRGGNGSLLWHSGNWSELPGEPVKVVDTVGAGDAFSAGLTMGWLHGLSLEKAHQLAATLASFVCSQPGAMPKLPEAFRRALAETPASKARH